MVSVQIDNVANEIRVGLPSRGWTSEMQTSLAALTSVSPGAVVTFSDATLPRTSSELDCAVNSEHEAGCGAPLRAGTSLYDTRTGSDGYHSFCTTGPNVQSNSDGKPYILTSGHCFARRGMDTSDATVWDNTDDNDQYSRIGVYHRSYYPTAPRTGDWGDIAVDSGVSRAATIYVQSSGGTRPTTGDPNYAIQSAGGTTVGAYYCKSGASGGTACGQVIATGQTNADTSNLGEINLFHSSNQACEGDSGGPIFAGHVLYGLTASGDTSSGTAPDGFPCYYYDYYVGIAAVMNDLDVFLNHQ